MARGPVRDWHLLLSAHGVSALGSMVTVVALPVVAIVQLGATTLQASQLVLAEFLPAAVLGPLGGLLIDRLPLRPLLVGADLLRAAALLAVPITLNAGAGSIWLLIGLAAVLGVLTALFNAAAETAMPSVVPQPMLARANSQRSTVQSIARIVGPAMGGLLVGLVSAANAMIADSATFVVSAALIAGIRADRMRAGIGRQGPARTVARLREGFRTIRTDVVLFRGVLGMATLNFAGGGIGALFYVYAFRRLGLDAADVGLALSFASGGALAGALASTVVGRWLGQTRACLVGATVVAGSLFGVPAATLGAPLALLMFYEAAFGVGAAVWSITMATLRQSRTPAERLGRVSSVHGAVAIATLPLGTLVAGLIGDTLGLTRAILVLAAVGALTPIWYATPAFLRAVAPAARTAEAAPANT